MKKFLKKSPNGVWYNTRYYPQPYVPKRSYDRVKILKWIGVVMFIIGAVLNSINVYPLNSVFLLTGGFIWAGVGYLTKDWPLMWLNLNMNAIYVMGLAWKLL
jgi:hypothetical protein